MLDFAVPALFALFVWWFGTGVVLYLDRLPRHTYRWSLTVAGAVLIAAFFGLIEASQGTDVAHAYLAFLCGVTLWGCLEMSYFMGLLTGPRKAPCPAGCNGWRRFTLAVGTSLYHELAVVVCAGAIAALTWNAPNQIGAWTFTVLWLMRWSAKLNVFLGVPNLHADWLPGHMKFLGSYMGQRSMNYLFPFSVTLATLAAVLVAMAAVAADPGGHLVPGLVLVTVLLGLAILEHWFLVLPIPDEALWRWAFTPETAAQTLDDDPGMTDARCLQPE